MLAKAADLSKGDWRDVRMLPEGFSRVDVADVNFDSRQINRGYSVSKRHARVGVGPRIDQNAAVRTQRRLHKIN